ncbi:Mariner Mos1 transposase [Eumeta japonica]|uniref:Mariner Mos1 transposase n=1 Tax=Eumeta variegata TaxID=151549 RepID=A0A4C1U092_EUMVA|nr:Mariner Mos1 transposase [Eumeta japonica]
MLQWEALPHPPYSPDIASSDFHLFPSIAHGLADQRFNFYEEAKKWIDSWIASRHVVFPTRNSYTARKLLMYSPDFGAARLDPCELRTVVPYTYTLSERLAELHGIAGGGRAAGTAAGRGSRARVRLRLTDHLFMCVIKTAGRPANAGRCCDVGDLYLTNHHAYLQALLCIANDGGGS